MVLFFSHKITQEQKNDAKKLLGVEEFVALPKELQELFSFVPAELDDLKEYIKPFGDFLKQNTKSGDIALIQGDFGLSYKLVKYSKSIGVVPVYATTRRKSKEIQIENQVIKESLFEHVRFRKY